MLEIEIGSKKISLDIDGELRVKHFRKILPIFANPDLDDLGKGVEFVRAVSSKPEQDVKTVEEMTIEEFSALSEKIAEIVNVEKKTTA